MTTPSRLTSALADRYEIKREIGRGGMATVYLARDCRHERWVALKVLDPGLAAVLGVARFLAEIRVTANLQHPNLLPLFDSGEVDGLPFYVMPFVEGESLRARLDREHQLPVDAALRIATSIAAAVDHAHRHGVVHRDLKPENILLQDGAPVVADFGIALAVSRAGGARLTQTGLSLGTPQYMSPEQAAGDHALDGRSDIYSLATLTYEMLAGEPPHLGNTVQAILSKVLTERPPSVRVRRPTVQEHVASALERALEKLPADRFATATEFADALHGRGVEASQTARATTAPSPPPPPVHREAPAIASLLASPYVAIVGFAFAVFMTAAWWRASHRREVRTPVEFTLAFDSTSQPTLAGHVAMSPDGRSVAYQAAGARGERQLFVRAMHEDRARPVPDSEQGMIPFFSPDGQWLGYFVSGQLRKFQVDGGGTVTLADVGPRPMGASWGVNGTIAVSIGGKLLVVPAVGGSPRPLPADRSAPTDSTMRWPRWLADGKTILCARWTGSFDTSRILAISAKTGQTVDVGVTGSHPLGVIDGKLIYAGANSLLMSVGFDSRRLRAVGNPVPIADQVVVTANREGGVNASLGDDGSLIMARGNPAAQAFFVNTLTSVTVFAEPRRYSFPRFSPDGKYLAIGIEGPARSDVWIYELASHTFARLTSAGTLNDRPEWSPDSRRVLFRSNRSGRFAVWWQPVDGTGPAEKLFEDPEGDIWEGVLSPDGTTLVYRTGPTGGSDIWYRRLTGDTTRHALANTLFDEWEARISPDGRWAAYTSLESGTAQVYVRALWSAAARTQISVDGGSVPLWSRDGRTIYFAAGAAILSATVVTTPNFSVVSRDTVLERALPLPVTRGHANYDVAPDGKRFLVFKRVEGEARVVVIHGWKHGWREAQ